MNTFSACLVCSAGFPSKTPYCTVYLFSSFIFRKTIVEWHVLIKLLKACKKKKERRTFENIVFNAAIRLI